MNWPKGALIVGVIAIVGGAVLAVSRLLKK